MENTKNTDKLFEYYSIKNLYEKEINTAKEKIIKNENLNLKEKRQEMTKKKAKCVNCKRNVGTIFTRKADDLKTSLKAYCGDRENPCPLNINIEIDYVEYIPQLLIDFSKEINKIKNDIIKYKNNIIFGYNNVDTAEIKKITEDLEYNISYFNLMNVKYNDIDNNYEKNKKKEDLSLKLYEVIDEIKKLIQEFKNTNDKKYIKNAVELYIDVIIPLNKEIREIKYKHIDVEESENIFTLTQINTPIDDLENKDNDYIKILSFVIGMGKKTEKTRKKRTNLDKTNKTKKTH